MKTKDEDCVQAAIEESPDQVLPVMAESLTNLAGASASQGTRGAHQPLVSQTIIFISRSVELPLAVFCPFGCLVALFPRPVAASLDIA